MNAKQYTVRNVPQPVDRYLRKRAKISGKSLNQVIIEELSESAGVSDSGLGDSLDWFYGSNTIDDDVIKTLEEEDKIQKKLMKKQWESEKNNDNN